MATEKKETPPNLSKVKLYSVWIPLAWLLAKFTGVDPIRKGPTLVMKPEGKALNTILELDDNEISNKDGKIKIVNKLTNLYNTDKLNEKLEVSEKFETYRLTPCTSMQQFLFEFNHKYTYIKLRRQGTRI